MSNNQIEGKIIKQAYIWDDHNIINWDYERANVIFLLGQEEEKYDISKSLEDLLSKNITLTLYVKTKNVTENIMDKENVIVWDHNSMNVIYLPCAFEGVYILNVSNLLKTFLDKNILRKLHVYNTQNHFNY